MIDLSQLPSAAPPASPLVHSAPTDPGTSWAKDAQVVVDAPPDDEVDPRPDAQWPPDAVRTGVCGAVSPRVVALPGGGYRLYYTLILPRPGFPAGANDYDNATARILSATSPDGSTWTPEPGVRLSSEEGGAGEFRVVSSEVVPLLDGVERLRRRTRYGAPSPRTVAWCGHRSRESGLRLVAATTRLLGSSSWMTGDVDCTAVTGVGASSAPCRPTA